MGRPPKQESLKLSLDIRIPVTAAQKRLIAEAVSDEPGGMAAWSRQVLLRAAEERIASRRGVPSLGATERSVLALSTPGQADAVSSGTIGEDRTPAVSHGWEDVSQHVNQVEIPDFLNEIYHLSREKRNHLAIDAILRFFDEALLARDLLKCQETLRQMDAAQLSASMMKTVLVITGKARAWLPERTAFFERAMDALTATRGRADAERLLNKHA